MDQIFHKRGDTFVATAVWRDSAGNPVDLTPYTVTSQMRAVNYVQEVTVVKTNAVGGVFTCTVSAANAQNFPVTDSPGSRLFWDI